MNKKNKNDNGNCYERGEEAEALFEKIADGLYERVIHANTFEDTIEHWDWNLINGNISTKVEVKAMKTIGRGDEPQDDWIWVELLGETGDGWLYGGTSDWIAFQITDGFLIVPRLALIELMDYMKLHKFNKVITKFKEDAYYRYYRRALWKDKEISVAVEKTEIEKISIKKWHSIF